MVRECKEIPQYKKQINKAESQRLTMMNMILKNDWMRNVAKNNNFQHPKAIYSSRRLSFENLPQPKNPIIPEDEDDQDDYSLKDVQLRRRATTTGIKSDNRQINQFAKDRRSVQILSSQQSQNINAIMKYAPQIPPIQVPQHGQLERSDTIIQRRKIPASPITPVSPISPRYAPKPSTIANRKIKRKSRTFSVEERERLKNNNSLISSTSSANDLISTKK
ncbi:8668_t:CDS:2 [Diversispora eburnea]|uniref:8668_t:CDS:1 n=1 Tax=Diversispora eburnea TaxID=1213867 RepID=A0A9N9B4W2_9GLOM|nr:8668_t:CDS:2 [Diversispora eburnea]